MFGKVARIAGLAVAGVAMVTLAGCGGGSSSSSSGAASSSGGSSSSEASASSTPTAPATPPAPPPLTDAQKKELLSQLPAAYQNADLSNGEAKFAVCRTCHTTAQGAGDMIGPNLWGIFGRKAGSEPGFSYSDALKNAGWTWDADRINTWITNPHAVLPDTKMSFVGVPDANDRRDIIAYLKTQTSPPPAS